MGLSTRLRLRDSFLLGVYLSGVFCIQVACWAGEVPAVARGAVDDAIAKMRPALVRIRVVSTDYREGRELKMQAVGSGAIIRKDGYIITNHHVAGHGARLL